MKNRISASVLGIDILDLEKEVKSVKKLVDEFHIDVADGHFVPNLSFGADIARSVKKTSNKQLSIHLMVEKPLIFINDFIPLKPRIISFHIEAARNPDNIIYKLKKHKIKTGIVLNPETPLHRVEPLLRKVDQVLIMTVNPGFSGQKFIRLQLKKVKDLRKIDKNIEIGVDGGINKDTIKLAKEAGANVFYMGSAIFNNKDHKKAITHLKKLI